MTGQAAESLDWERLDPSDPSDDWKAWVRLVRPPAARIAPFPQRERPHLHWRQGTLFSSADDLRETLWSSRSTQPHTSEFRAPTTADLISEIRQRTELARLRHEIAELREENRRLRTQAHLMSSRVATERSIDIYGLTLPQPLAHFRASIERSRSMLELEDDWDGKGSPSYSEETWRSAVGIAIQSARRFITAGGTPPPAPAIAKGPEGSVDVLWQIGTKKLMINVPSDSDEPITYHGFDPENHWRETQGVIDPSDSNDWMLAWLTR